MAIPVHKRRGHGLSSVSPFERFMGCNLMKWVVNYGDDGKLLVLEWEARDLDGQDQHPSIPQVMVEMASKGGMMSS